SRGPVCEKRSCPESNCSARWFRPSIAPAFARLPCALRFAPRRPAPSRHPPGADMFTGIIEGVGSLAATEHRGGDVRLTVQAGTLPFEHVQLGESIAVNGVCLTVIAFDATSFQADASTETLALTTLGRLAA